MRSLGVSVIPLKPSTGYRTLKRDKNIAGDVRRLSAHPGRISCGFELKGKCHWKENSSRIYFYYIQWL